MRKYIQNLVGRMDEDLLELTLARLVRICEGNDKMLAPALPQKLPDYLKNDERIR